MSYGVNAPQGLVPLFNFKSSTLNSQTRPYSIYASLDGVNTLPYSIFTGDPVTFSSYNVGAAPYNSFGTISPYLPAYNANAQPGVYTYGSPSIAGGNTTITPQALVGVFAGCQYYSSATGNLVSSPYWPAGTRVKSGTQITAFIYDDPDIVYDIQISSPTTYWQNACFQGLGNAAVNRLTIGSNAAIDIAYPGAWANPLPGFATNYNNGGVGYTHGGAAAIYPFLAGGATGGNILTTGNISTGSSNYYLSGGTAIAANLADDYNKNGANSTALPLKIIGLTPNPQNIALYKQSLAGAPGNNVNTTQPFLNVLVVLNNHFLRAGTAGATFA